ncbi:hypothetical protein HPC38_05020 [Pasteurellaceae bacterium HPA106]|uniref:hypothetical protein n=1 Tax=Spirabiliibacterium pneumoniae TaxID=221400 RepID=UPI001AAC6F36|nr:hypothetical protein [Spirabiliibacterium pneumoniae]MBE2896236.1 hypothetical protein [Spirabiliibacterium pneumoniae]
MRNVEGCLTSLKHTANSLDMAYSVIYLMLEKIGHCDEDFQADLDSRGLKGGIEAVHNLLFDTIKSLDSDIDNLAKALKEIKK